MTGCVLQTTAVGEAVTQRLAVNEAARGAMLGLRSLGPSFSTTDLRGTDAEHAQALQRVFPGARRRPLFARQLRVVGGEGYRPLKEW